MAKEGKEEKEARTSRPFNPKAISVIAKPLADDKLCKKVLKLAKKGAKRKQIKRGVKEVVKALRKKQSGICIIAGDISPIDVVTHLPVMCEDRDVPYIYVPSKEELGAAGLTKRPTSCMLVMPKPLKHATEDDESKEFLESYEDVAKRVKKVQPIF
jgi:H/ACA ribonucleoprotein complex subunit 2